MDSYSKPNCTPLIPAKKVDAYTDLYHDVHSKNDASITLDTSWGKVEHDLTPQIKAGETVTCLLPNDERERIEYFPENYNAELNKPINCVTGKQIADWINVEDLKDVAIDTKNNGDVLYWNGTDWIDYNIKEVLDNIDQTLEEHHTQITNLINKTQQLEQTINNLTAELNGVVLRLSDIEKAIYNWTADKTTKIPRGNINVTSGATNSTAGLFTHSGEANNDLNFS